MTLLSIVQDACDRLGLVRPDAAYTSSDQQIIQLVALAQQEGRELAARHDWQVLTAEQTFTATATETQSSALPSDFDRIVNGSFFNRTRKRPVHGPLSAQEWQFAKGVVTTTIIEAWRQRGGDILITPTATAGDSYAFEYVSDLWCRDSGGTGQNAWASDTDTGKLPEEIITDGVVWRFLKAKGFDYAEEFRTYEVRVRQFAAREGGKVTVNAGRSRSATRGIYTPDGNWNL